MLVIMFVFGMENSSCADVLIAEQDLSSNIKRSAIFIPDPIADGGWVVIPSFPVFSPPVDGRISSFYGWRKDPFLANVRFHRGVDISTAKGCKVLSSHDGIIQYAGWGDDCGLMVVVNHEYGFSSRYCHLSEVWVESGDWITRGEDIGSVGDTGRATGPHLHFEIRLAGRSIDPAEVLGY